MVINYKKIIHPFTLNNHYISYFYPLVLFNFEESPSIKITQVEQMKKNGNLWVTIVVVVLLIAGTLFTLLTIRHVDSVMREDLLKQAQLIRQAISDDPLTSLVGTEADSASDQYQRLKRQLAVIQYNNRGIRYIYLMGRHKNGNVFFFLDTDEQSPTVSGENYSEASVRLKQIFDNNIPFVEGPIADKWGTWVSALVPVTRASSESQGIILGIDVDARTWNRKLVLASLVPALFFLFLVALVLVAAKLMSARKKLGYKAPAWMKNLETILAFSFGLVLTVFATINTFQRVSLDRTHSFTALAESKTTNMASRLKNLRSVELEGLANHYMSNKDISIDEFQGSTRYLAQNQEVQAWGWIEMVTDNEKQNAEMEEQSEGIEGFRIWQPDKNGKPVPAHGRNVYYPLIRVAPIQTNGRLIGYDLGAEPECLAAIKEAAHTGLITASETVKPMQVIGNEKVILIFRPVFKSNNLQKQVRGFALAVLKLNSLFLAEENDQTIALEFTLLHKQRAPELLSTSYGSFHPKVSGLTLNRPVFLFGKVYSVTAHADYNFERVHTIETVWFTAIAGFLLTFALTFIVNTGSRRREKLEKLVFERTSDLQESEALFRTLFENSPVGKAMTSTNGILKVNKSFCEIVGYTEEELLSKKYMEVTHPDDIKERESIICSIIAGEKNTARFESRYIHKNGNIIWVELSTFLQRDAEGKPRFFINTVNNITERKRTEEKLLQSEKKYRSVFENVQDVYYELHMDGTIIEMSPSIEIVSNGLYTREDLIGKSMFDFYVDINQRYQAHAALQEHGRVTDYEMTFLNRDGSYLYCAFSAKLVYDSNGNPEKVIGSMHDITSRKRVEKALKAEESRMRAITESTQDAILMMDPEGNISFVNPAATRIFGYSREEMLGKNLHMLLAPPRYHQAHKDAMPAFTLTGEGRSLGKNLEFQAVCKAGNEIFIELSLSALELSDGWYSVGIIRDITERKKAQDALRMSEATYRNLIEKMPDGVYKSTHDGKFLEVNPAMVKMLGYENKEELFAIDLRKELYFDPSERDRLVLDDMNKELSIFMLRKKDGSGVWIEDHGWYTLSDKGEILFHEGVMRDISERIHAEIALRESEEKFKNLAESTPFAILILQNGKWMYCNKAGEQISGFTFEELSQMDFWDMVHPDDADEVKERGYLRQSGEKTDSSYEFRVINRSGELKWLFLSGTSISYYGKPASLISVADITERKKAEAALRESEDLWHTIIDTSPDGIAISRLDGTILNVSKQGVLKWGFTSESEVIGRNILEFIDQEYVKKAMDNINLMQAGFFTGPAEYLMLKTDGERFFNEVNAELIKDESGEAKRMLFVLRDITERKIAEMEVKHLNEELEERVKERTAELQAANDELETFSYTASHDLRTPLRALDGFANILLQDYAPELDDEAKRLLNVIIQNANKMGHLIDDLLSFSRLSRYTLHKADIDMKDKAMSVYFELTTAAEREVINFCIMDIPRAVGDPAMIRQVWSNLLSNAIKYTSKKMDRVIEVGYTTIGMELVYFVKDNGAGFNMQYSEKLFGVFQRLHTPKEFEGTGIGLATVQRIISRHGGRIWGEGEVGVGATFYFMLPSK